MNLLTFWIMAHLVLPTLTVESTAFEYSKMIPSKYTCDGQNINPPLAIGNIPPGTKTLAIIMDDPDTKRGTFDHWVMWNIPPQGKIEENSAPGRQGSNGKKQNAYTGPCPPDGVHRYFFKVYALDTELDLPEGTGKRTLEDAMEGHILAKGELMGRYDRRR